MSARARAIEQLPRRFTPQLATLVSTAPDGDAWLHELKYDGYRIGCRIDRGTVRLLSRNGNDWTARFPSLREAAMRLPVRTALLDGEVTVVLPDGRTSFQALQNALLAAPRSGTLVYFVFDLLHLDGTDIGRLPLEQRKARLQRALGSTGGVIRYADHTIGDGPRIFSAACRRGAEGIVSKRRDLQYRPGRGGGWLKIKCIARQEFVIGGFTDPQGARVGLGALLVGVHDARGRLVFAGKVGTGFTQATARALRERLDAIEQADCPFASPPAGRLGRGVHWVQPTLVAEVAFTEWTADGKIRHPSFQGVRADKRPSQVRRERPTAPSRRRPAARGRSGISPQ